MKTKLGIRKARMLSRLATMNLCHLIGNHDHTSSCSGDFPEIEKDLELQVLDITRRRNTEYWTNKRR